MSDGSKGGTQHLVTTDMLADEAELTMDRVDEEILRLTLVPRDAATISFLFWEWQDPRSQRECRDCVDEVLGRFSTRGWVTYDDATQYWSITNLGENQIADERIRRSSHFQRTSPDVIQSDLGYSIQFLRTDSYVKRLRYEEGRRWLTLECEVLDKVGIRDGLISVTSWETSRGPEELDDAERGRVRDNIMWALEFREGKFLS